MYGVTVKRNVMCHDNEQDSLNTSPLIENISGLNLTKYIKRYVIWMQAFKCTFKTNLTPF